MNMTPAITAPPMARLRGLKKPDMVGLMEWSEEDVMLSIGLSVFVRSTDLNKDKRTVKMSQSKALSTVNTTDRASR